MVPVSRTASPSTARSPAIEMRPGTAPPPAAPATESASGAGAATVGSGPVRAPGPRTPRPAGRWSEAPPARPAVPSTGLGQPSRRSASSHGAAGPSSASTTDAESAARKVRRPLVDRWSRPPPGRIDRSRPNRVGTPAVLRPGEGEVHGAPPDHPVAIGQPHPRNRRVGATRPRFPRSSADGATSDTSGPSAVAAI